MALVAYGSSDESENEEEEEMVQSVPKPSNNIVKNNVQRILETIDDEEIFEEVVVREPKLTSKKSFDEDITDYSEDQSTSSNTFQLKLPPPKHRNVNFSNLTLKPHTLRLLPSLNQVKSSESDEPPKKKPTPSLQKRNGLLDMLPTPKIDYDSALGKETSKTPLLPMSLIKPKPVLSTPTKSTTPKPATTNKDDDENDVGTDFFSLAATYPEDEHFEPIDIELPAPVTTHKTVPAGQKVPTNARESAQAQILSNYYSQKSNVVETGNDESSSSSASSSVSLDNEALKTFFGRKHKGQVPEEFQIIDVNEEDVLIESRQMLTKQLTEEVAHRPTFKKGLGPTSMQKRKHQITYLAYQAKEREMELKNQWANNRLTKRQTQSKYGF